MITEAAMPKFTQFWLLPLETNLYCARISLLYRYIISSFLAEAVGALKYVVQSAASLHLQDELLVQYFCYSYTCFTK